MKSEYNIEKKCKKHKIKKEVDIGGVMFCEKCLEEGVERMEKSGVLESKTEKLHQKAKKDAKKTGGYY